MSRTDGAEWPRIGGWWVRPSNWVANTTFAAVGIAGVVFAAWNVSADHEVRPDSLVPQLWTSAKRGLHILQRRVTQPDRWIPSMLVSPVTRYYFE